MHSFLQLAQGIKDLFIMPVEQYQKDGRLMRGFQKGNFKGFFTLFWLFPIILLAHHIPTTNPEKWETTFFTNFDICLNQDLVFLM